MMYNSVTCFLSPLFFFFVDSANGKIMVLLSSVLCVLLSCLPLVHVMTASPSDLLHLSMAIRYHQKEQTDKVLAPVNIINTYI